MVGIICIKRRWLFIFLIITILLNFAGSIHWAQSEGEWYCFHGLDRTNKSQETGLLDKWPVGGPDKLWTVSGLGKGYSSVSIAEGYIFTAGMSDNKTYVFAFDLNGKKIWQRENGASWETTRSHARTYNGSRSTPTYDEGVIYHLSDLGRLSALQAKTGEEIWVIELREEFDAEIPEYGYSESVLIEGDRLYCSPAGNKGYMICLNKRSGELIWANTEIPGSVGFSSPIIGEFAGFRQLVNLSATYIYGVDIKTGRSLWKVEYENQRSNSCSDPIFHKGYIFVASGYGKGSILLKFSSSGGQVIPEIVWQEKIMDNLHGGVIFHEGYLYGSGHNKRGWYCLDFFTGKQMWKERGIGAITYADNMIYCLEERGMLKLVKVTPEKYEAVSSFQVPSGGEGMYWAHPVVCGGRLYVRHDDMLFAYDIKEQ